MKLFIWKLVQNLTDREHSTGGLVVVADNEDRARALVRAHKTEGYNSKSMHTPQLSDSYKPDIVLQLADGAAEMVLDFPNAGCC